MCADPRPGKALRVALRAQRGSLLLEFMVVAALGLMLAIWAGQEWSQRARALQAQALAAWMVPARTAAAGFLARYAGELRQAEGPAALAAQGVADWSAPTWAELQALGLLPSGWRDTGPLRQGLALRIEREAACPDLPCHLRALVAARPGLMRTSGQATDEALMAEWLQAAEGRGLVIQTRAPIVLAGAGRRLAVPAGAAWGPGTVALLAEQTLLTEDPAPSGGTGQEADFLRVRDPRDPDFQGDASVRGSVRSGAWLQGNDGLVLDQGWVGGQACTREGAVGRDARFPGLLSCRQGTWERLARPAGGGYMFNSSRGCLSRSGTPSGNPVTGDCSCPPAYLPVQVAESGSLMTPEGVTQGVLCVPSGQ